MKQSVFYVFLIIFVVQNLSYNNNLSKLVLTCIDHFLVFIGQPWLIIKIITICYRTISFIIYQWKVFNLNIVFLTVFQRQAYFFLLHFDLDEKYKLSSMIENKITMTPQLGTRKTSFANIIYGHVKILYSIQKLYTWVM